MTEDQIAALVRVVRDEVDARLAAQGGKPAPSASTKAMADEIFAAVRDYLKRVLDPLVTRIEALEAKE